MSDSHRFVPLQYQAKTGQELIDCSAQFYESMRQRRTVRNFSDTPVPLQLIENAVAAAGTAPSGANQQPWHFVAVSDADTKRKIRVAAEIEERELYERRASDQWLEALAPLGTNADKPFLETAPWLIAVFGQKFTIDAEGRKLKHYYTQESVGIATGILITALHQSGLVALTHTPSPMGFLREELDRPIHEKPFLLLVVGYPADDAMVPDIDKKPLGDILSIR